MLQIFYPEDIQRVLLALASAGAARGPEYVKALGDVALAFGVQPPTPTKIWHEVDTLADHTPEVE